MDEFGGHPGALVGHVDLHAVFCADGVNGHGAAAVGQGIVDEVAGRALDLEAIGA